MEQTWRYDASCNRVSPVAQPETTFQFFFLFWVHPKIDKRGLARDGTPNNKSKKKCVLTKKRSASAYDDSEIVWCGKLPVWSNNTAYTVSKLLVPLGKFHRTHTKHLFVKSSDGYCMSFRVSHS